ncbi:MAG: stage II sporulation protein P [Oscillospiraceae bacterium]|nr:stage II sporulation protein P [Oscillospiraceae bacterium]
MKRLIQKFAALACAVIAVKLCFAAAALPLAVSETLSRAMFALEFGGGFDASAEARGGMTESNEAAMLSSEVPLAVTESDNALFAEPDDYQILQPNANSQSALRPITQPIENSAYVPKIENKSQTSIDALTLLADAPDINLQEGCAQILIIHTHGSEAFIDSEGYRSLDTAQNIVAVGDAFAEELQNRGLYVIHDRACYDQPTYNGSYNRSADAVTEWLEKYPSIQIVFDIHRDALELPDGTQRATMYSPLGTDSRTAQVMIYATNGDNGLDHPNWRENMKFALRLQKSADALFPGLTRPLCVSGQRFNEHLAPGYLLLEVGSAGNTTEEAIAAARLFAASASDVITPLIN